MRLLAAFADAGGREDLDDVGAVLLQLTHLLANLGRRPAALVELSDRRQHARTREDAARDRRRAARRRWPGPGLWIVVKPAISVV